VDFAYRKVINGGRDGTGSTALALVQSVALRAVNGVHANGKAGSGVHGIDRVTIIFFLR
jgi:hypothetical protein